MISDRRWEGRKEQDDCVVWLLENELRQFSREEGVTMADSVETLCDMRTRVKRLGAKEKAWRKKCKVRFSLTKTA